MKMGVCNYLLAGISNHQDHGVWIAQELYPGRDSDHYLAQARNGS